MKRKGQLLPILVILSLMGVMSLAACGPKGGTVVYGKVTVVDNDTITIAVGTLNQQTNGMEDIPSGAGNGQPRTTSDGYPGGRYPGNESGMPSDGSFSRPEIPSGFDPSAGFPGRRPGDGSGATSGFDGGNNRFPQGNPFDLSNLLTLTGSMKFVTISDSLTITKISALSVMGIGSPVSSPDNPGTLADIKIGSVLRITYQKGSDKILSIDIIDSSMQPGAFKPG